MGKAKMAMSVEVKDRVDKNKARQVFGATLLIQFYMMFIVMSDQPSASIPLPHNNSSWHGMCPSALYRYQFLLLLETSNTVCLRSQQFYHAFDRNNPGEAAGE